MNTPEPKPKLTTSQLVNKYAKIAGDIYDKRTVGDYTFVGLFGAFLNEWLENDDPEPELVTDAMVEAAARAYIETIND